MAEARAPRNMEKGAARRAFIETLQKEGYFLVKDNTVYLEVVSQKDKKTRGLIDLAKLEGYALDSVMDQLLKGDPKAYAAFKLRQAIEEAQKHGAAEEVISSILNE